MLRHHSPESVCAVHSSALIDCVMSLQQGSADAIAAQLGVGSTEPPHRHVGVVQPARKAAGQRQDSLRSVGLGLDQVSSAVGELRPGPATAGKPLEPSWLANIPWSKGGHIDPPKIRECRCASGLLGASHGLS